jgi:hypothetical protein
MLFLDGSCLFIVDAKSRPCCNPPMEFSQNHSNNSNICLLGNWFSDKAFQSHQLNHGILRKAILEVVKIPSPLVPHYESSARSV